MQHLAFADDDDESKGLFQAIWSTVLHPFDAIGSSVKKASGYLGKIGLTIQILGESMGSGE